MGDDEDIPIIMGMATETCMSSIQGSCTQISSQSTNIKIPTCPIIKGKMIVHAPGAPGETAMLCNI